MNGIRFTIGLVILAVLAGAAWIARYDIESASKSVVFVYRLDRWTGQVEVVDMRDELERLEQRR